MHWWLVDYAATVYFFLGILALALAALWWTNRKRYYLGALAVVAGLAAIVFLLGWLIVTDRQQIRANILAMRQGVVEGKPDQVFRHFARNFRHQTMDRQAFIDRAGQAIRRHQVQDVILWNCDFEVPPDRERNAEVAFNVRAIGAWGEAWYLCRAVFVFEDQQLRMSGLQFFNPIANTNQPNPNTL